MVRRHENLKIWQKSYDLAKDLIQVTERFPRPQQLGGLASEIRQTALSLIRTVMLANSIASWIGYTKHADCHGLNCQIAERHPFLRVAFDPVEVTE
jgi:hypothetical protein